MKASVSKVYTANRCLRKYKYSYVDNLVPQRKDARPTLGVLGHKALENYYLGKDWTSPIKEYEALLATMMDEERELYAHIPGDLYRIMKGYILRNKDSDKNFKVLATEQKFEVPTPDGNIYNGIMDLVLEDKTGVWIQDNKFVKVIPDDSVRFYDMQTSLYYYAASKLGLKPVGIMFNYLRTKAPSQPKLLKNGTISRAACDTDAVTYYTAVKNAGLNPSDYSELIEALKKNQFYKKFKLPVPEEVTAELIKDLDSTCAMLTHAEANSVFPRAMNRNCSWDCDYCKLCFAELAHQNVEYILASDYTNKTEEKFDGDEESST